MTIPSGEQGPKELSEENRVDHGLEELRLIVDSVRPRKFRAVLYNNVDFDRIHIFPESLDDLLPTAQRGSVTMKRSDFDG